MISDENNLTVPEISAYSREQIEGGVLVRYLIRQPGETEWRVARLFRANEPVANEPVANEREEEKTR